MTLDLHDTSHCPIGHRCESCGQATATLQVVTRTVLSSVLCLTMCKRCRQSNQPPSIQVSTAERLVEQHRQHVRTVTPVYRLRPENSAS
jgi:hypothetical protein